MTTITQPPTPATEPEDALLELGASFDDLYAIVQARTVHGGQVVEAQVTAVSGDVVRVDVQGTPGTVPAGECDPPPAPGDTLRIYVQQVLADGLECSRHKAERLDLFDRLEAAAREGTPVNGVVTARMRGGWAVDIGMKAFLPRKEYPDASEDPEQVLGTSLSLRVLRWDDKKSWFAVSTREDAPTLAAAAPGPTERPQLDLEPVGLDELEEGDIVNGVVTRMADFGAFVDLGGTTGLLHVTDLSWGRLEHPREAVQLGDHLRVKVLKIDHEKGKLSLGLKQLQPHPWTNAAERFPVGTRVAGRVISMQPYGAFVEVEPGVEGLVHVSELAWDRRVKHPNEVLAQGDRIEAIVVLCDPEHQKLKLSVKRTLPSPWARLREALPPGTRLEGPIRSITEFGLFVSIADGIDGLVHKTDVDWNRDDAPLSERFRRGQKVEVMVLDIDDERERASLGMKQLVSRAEAEEAAAAEHASDAPSEPGSDAPDVAASDAPTGPASEAPAVAASDAPTEPASEAPAVAASDAPSAVPSEATSEATSEARAEPTGDATDKPSDAP